jgi:hypothetical protein
MKSQPEIECKITELQDRLERIEAAIAKEMEIVFDKRQMRFLNFLNKERAVYRFALSEFEWILKNGE